MDKCQFKYQLNLIYYGLIIANVLNFANSSKSDGSFTLASSNSFLSPYEILPIAQVNTYSGKLSYFITKFYVECTH